MTPKKAKNWRIHSWGRSAVALWENVALPYWDEPEEATLTEGIPQAFPEKEYTFTDPNSIPNPFFSHKFRSKIADRLPVVPDAHYTKPIGYETVRSSTAPPPRGSFVVSAREP
ncbi:hypothetical protein LY76DRAFT_643017 [Colletotrichum caudatum]|nr:hypothetical protein LY76DRAFT_643017 [Colletotrichum caudatum]